MMAESISRSQSAPESGALRLWETLLSITIFLSGEITKSGPGNEAWEVTKNDSDNEAWEIRTRLKLVK